MFRQVLKNTMTTHKHTRTCRTLHWNTHTHTQELRSIQVCTADFCFWHKHYLLIRRSVRSVSFTPFRVRCILVLIKTQIFRESEHKQANRQTASSSEHMRAKLTCVNIYGMTSLRFISSECDDAQKRISGKKGADQKFCPVWACSLIRTLLWLIYIKAPQQEKPRSSSIPLPALGTMK